MQNPWEVDWGKQAPQASAMPWEVDWSKPPSATPVETADTAKGFKRAFAQVPELAYGTATLAAMSAENLFGEGGISTTAKNYFAEKTAAKQAENQKYAPAVDFTDAWDNLKRGEVGGMVDWLQDSAGYVAGQVLQTVVTGGVGGAIGKTALSVATQKMLGGVVAKQATKIAEEAVIKQGLTGEAREAAIKALLPEATKQAAQRTAQVIGAGAALSAQNVGMEAGDIYGGLREQAEKTGTPITGDDLLRAWGAAAAAAGTETATDLLGLGALTGRIKIGGKAMQEMTGVGGRATRAGTAAAIGMPLEASQEYVQTGLEQYGAGKPLDTPEAERERINAAAVGGLGGTVVGGGVGLLQSARAPTTPEIIAAVTDPGKSLDESIAAASAAIKAPELDIPAPGLINSAEPLPPRVRSMAATQANIQVGEEARIEAERGRILEESRLPVALADAETQDTIAQRSGALDAAEAPTAMQLAFQRAQEAKAASQRPITTPLAPKTVGGEPVDAQSDEQLRALAADPATPAITRHAAVSAIQARVAPAPPAPPALSPQERMVAERRAIEAGTARQPVEPGLDTPARAAPAQPQTSAAVAPQSQQTPAPAVASATPTQRAGIPEAAKSILLNVENGLEQFSNYNVADKERRIATRLLEGKGDVAALWSEYAHYEEQGLVQGGPVQPKTASPEKRAIARALRLIVGSRQAPEAAVAPAPVTAPPIPKIAGKLASEMTDAGLRTALKAGAARVKVIAQAEIDRRDVESGAKAMREALIEPNVRSAVVGMRSGIGRDDVGGRLIIDETTRGQVPGTGDVLGKTVHTGNPWWFQRPDPIPAAQARKAIDKALAGEPLGTRDQRFVNYVVDLVKQDEAELAQDEALAESFADEIHSADWSKLSNEERDAETDRALGGAPAAVQSPAPEAAGAGTRVGEGETRQEAPAEVAGQVAEPVQFTPNESSLQQRLKSQLADANAAVEHRKTEIAAFEKWEREHPGYQADPDAHDEATRINEYRRELPRAERDAEQLQKHLDTETDRLQALGGQGNLVLTGQTEAELAAAEAKRSAEVAQKAAEEANAAAREKRAANKAEEDRRAAEVLAEREAAKKAEVDAAAADFQLGQEAPAPVVKKVTTDEAAGQGDLLAAAEQPRTSYNPNQLDLIYDNAETRPGTTEEQRSTGIAALRGLLARDRRAGASILGSALWRDFTEGKGSDLIGQRADSPQELAALAQVLRDPRFETLRVFFTKGGEIVGHSGITSRLPGVVQFATSLPGVKERYAALNAMQYRLGADGYWLSHNHPSGQSKPSQADVMLTSTFADQMPGFKGHVVIDRDEFSTINKFGDTERHYIKSPQIQTPEVPHEILGRPIMSHDALVNVNKALQARTGYAVLISTNHAGNVSALAEVPEPLLEKSAGKWKASARVRRFKRMTSGSRIFLVTDKPSAFNYLIEEGAIEDITSFSGEQTSRGGAGGPIPNSGRAPKPGVLSAEQERAAFSRAPIFYSDLARKVESMSTNAAPAQAWKSAIRNLTQKGVKQDEIEWSGINDFLDIQQGKVTKQAIVDFLRENGVRVEETVLGGGARVSEGLAGAADAFPDGIPTTPDGWMGLSERLERIAQRHQRNGNEADAQRYFTLAEESNRHAEGLDFDTASTAGQAKFASYQLPGGQNYRELLLRLPVSAEGSRGWQDWRDELTQRTGDGHAADEVRRYLLGAPEDSIDMPAVEKARAVVGDAWFGKYKAVLADKTRRPIIENQFRSSHFDQPNIIAHVRFNERTDAEGKRVLFIEEIQSDWAQKGRREGFLAKDRPTVVVKEGNYSGFWTSFVNRPDGSQHQVGSQFSSRREAEIAGENYARAQGMQMGAIPTAPFVGKTEAWVSLALKRMIRYAAENGFDRVAFITGQQSADRYDLSKHLSSVEATLERDGTYSIVGRNHNMRGGRGNDVVHQSGLKKEDLPGVVGKDLADKIVARLFPGSSTAQWSGLDLKVGGEGMRQFYDSIVPSVARDVLKKLGGGKVGTVDMGASRTVEDENDIQPGFDITPQMREKALGGQPLFRRGTTEGRLSLAETRTALAEAIAKISAPVDIFPDTESAGRALDIAAPADMEGVSYRGRIAIVSENLRDQLHAEMVLWHEVFHTGLRSRPKEYESALTRVAMANPEVRRRGAAWRENFGADYLKDLKKRGITGDEAQKTLRFMGWEEGVAEIAGENRGQPLRLIDQFIAALQKMLRDIGLERLADWMENKTSAEVLSLIQRSTDAITKPAPQPLTATNAPAYMTAYHGSPHDFDQFSMQKIGTGEGAQAYGFGLYFAGKREVAEHYKNALSHRGFLFDGEYVENPDAWVDKVAAEYHVDSRAVQRALSDFRSGESVSRIEGRALQQYDKVTASRIRHIAEGLERAQSGESLQPRGGKRAIDAMTDAERSAYYDMFGSAHWYKTDTIARLREQAERTIAAQKTYLDSDYESERKQAKRLIPENEEKLRVIDKYGLRMFNIPSGRLYQVELAPKEDEYLDYDKQVPDEQLAKIPSPMREQIDEFLQDHTDLSLDDLTGRELYQTIARFASEGGINLPGTENVSDHRELASRYLSSIGIPGIRYLDASSRSEWFVRMAGNANDPTIGKMLPPNARFVAEDRSTGNTSPSFETRADAQAWIKRQDQFNTSNYVIFDDKHVSIEAKFSRSDQTQTPEFQRWFGESRVVDENGEPMRVYHGTAQDIQTLRPSVGDQHLVDGIYLTRQQDHAAAYASRDDSDDGGNIMPLFASIKNPAFDVARNEVYDEFKSEFGRWPNSTEAREALERAGYDGAVNEGPVGGMIDAIEIIAFRPNQIKSAIGNRGTFDPQNADIAFSRAGGAVGSRASWDAPEPSKMDNVIYTLQDKHIDTKRVLESIRTHSAVTDDMDVRLKEELYHERSAKRVQDFANKELKPLFTEMAMRGVKTTEDIAAFEKYLLARHAEEANDHIAAINPNLPDGGSGMTTSDANDHMARLDPQKKRAYEALAARIDAINEKTRATLVEYQLESQETVDGWRQMFDHYVPLQREDMGSGPGIGQGFSVRGPATRSRTGSTKNVVDIIANIAMQRERTITRGEKNRVATALVGLATANPNADFWRVDKPPLMVRLDDRTGVLRSMVDPMYKSRENVVMSRTFDANGDVVEHAVIFNEQDERALRMSKALKNLDMDDLGHLLGVSAKITRYFASINTQWNPVFGVVNLVRDTQGAIFNLQSTPLAGKQTEVLKHTLSALRGIYIDLRDTRAGKPTSSTWAQLWDEFQEVGGPTGYKDMFRTSKDRGEAIEREIRRIGENKATQLGRGMFDLLSDYNQAMENAVRLSAYKVGTESGMTKERAASLAKNLTVNFNRKGQIGAQAGALYAFYNAAIQGTARLAETLDIKMKNGVPTLGPRGQKIIASGVGLGVMQALMLAAAGFDDDEPPAFMRERNLIIPIGDKKYITIPMPLGLHFFPNLGRIPAEYVLSGFRNPGKRVTQLVGMFAEAFNPIGNAGFSLQTIAPTIIDPLAALAENKDWTGKPIARKDFGLNVTPGHTRAKDTATMWSKAMSQGINWASGGSNYKPGAFSPTPDQIDYLIGQVTGGVGREFGKAVQTGQSAITGEDLPTYKIPLVGRFYGESDQPSAQANRFYSALKDLNEHEAEIKGRRKAGESVADYLRENPEARLFQQANRVEREVSQLRKRKRELMEKDAGRESIKMVEQQITARMTRLNDAVRSARETAAP